MRVLALTALLIPAALAACSTSPAPPEGGPPPLTPPRAAAPVPGSVMGRWSSASCGERAYERRLSFDADGSFTAEDRIAPCPPNARCVWSGIVIRHGKYAVAGGVVQLAVDGPSAGPGRPLPATVVIDATGAPAEVLASGERCPYARLP